MKKGLISFLIIVILIIGGVIIYQNLAKKQKILLKEDIMSEKSFTNKKIVMIIAFKDFRDEEYFVPKDILEKAGIEVKTASNKMGTAIGADGGEAEVDLLVSEINPADFDAIIFVGGPGCLKNLDNENSYQLARKTIAEDKVLAAICISPVILAKAGVLKDKKATVWSSSLDRSSVEILKENGAIIYEAQEIVIDGKIITANGPDAAGDFAKAVHLAVSE